ncbi:kinesin-like protein KIN-7F [Heracleum sosnowskyi]|uniref:Kinesin-like protein n=1 Tax=Heracleum sosnowskyi TaxID=360622 RepID=A0AAD8HLK6_9APIA|nr:kinesin-like protein KIN-7F [Heracleum sosnowskyi]
MEASSEEEHLTKSENKQGGACAREEKILVLVRLRPLSAMEIARNEVSDWECINESSILFRNSLQERSMSPTAYTYDRVFGGDCSTRQLYDAGAKEIALSVVSGINSSIFAYGQTSSGKTYTMLGITQYTVADIYDYIRRHEERAFVLKVSAMEIYNEVVKDLLSTNSTPLRLLDDPERGTVVEKLTEEILRDQKHLKKLLSVCEAQRQVQETSLNETSSRSHQILRLTIESCACDVIGKGKSAILAASVNFIDLAGSERVSQSLSVGQRLKEGCHINRSLLTLSTVIRKLSKGRHGHVNYRDSKLTRILQPCLGGNARTAIICTLSPALRHVEQSRNTLLFARCAKEVRTNAQVNVVMSDKALVKHLQKELAQLEGDSRTPVPTSISDHIALLRRKDLQIEKLEREVKELIKQRDLAQANLEDALCEIKNGHSSHQCKRKNGDPYHPSDDDEDLSDGTSSSVSNRRNFLKSSLYQGLEESTPGSDKVSNTICKDVCCFMMNESRKNESTDPLFQTAGKDNVRGSALAVSGNGELEDEEIMSSSPREVSLPQNSSNYGSPGRGVHDVQKTIDTRLGDSPVEPSPWSLVTDLSSSGCLRSSRSSTCTPHLMTSQNLEMLQPNEKPSPNLSTKLLRERSPHSKRRIPPLNYNDDNARHSRNNSEFSVGSAQLDELSGQNRVPEDEGIPSIDTFVAGMEEMAKLQYDKDASDNQVGETDLKLQVVAKNVRDVGLDPIQNVIGTLSDWPVEFERLQRSILELWQTCNVSLVHRTYFVLLFKGHPADSIYMEVELRRLSFVKETFSKEDLEVDDGRTPTLASSLRALRRERETLSKLVSRRFSQEQRKWIYEKWDISLDSKRRKLQLIQRLWSDTKDMNHIMESAAIVARLLRFSELDRPPKETFGLSFTPRIIRKSFG